MTDESHRSHHKPHHSSPTPDPIPGLAPKHHQPQSRACPPIPIHHPSQPQSRVCPLIPLSTPSSIPGLSPIRHLTEYRFAEYEYRFAEYEYEKFVLKQERFDDGRDRWCDVDDLLHPMTGSAIAARQLSRFRTLLRQPDAVRQEERPRVHSGNTIFPRCSPSPRRFERGQSRRAL